MNEIAVQLAQQSDPANLALLAVVWWRLNRRLRRLEGRLSGFDGEGRP